MISKLYSLKLSDFQKGAILAVAVGFFGVFQQLFIVHGFDFGSYDWGLIANAMVLAEMGYLSKNYFSSNNGVTEKVAGITLSK